MAKNLYIRTWLATFQGSCHHIQSQNVGFGVLVLGSRHSGDSGLGVWGVLPTAAGINSSRFRSCSLHKDIGVMQIGILNG